MNLKQAQKLARVAERAVPLLSIYHEEGEPKPTADIGVEGYEGNDVLIRLVSYDDSLVRFPRGLCITEAGELCQWDEDTQTNVPVLLVWRYGDPADGLERHMRICEARPIAVAAEATAA